MVRLDDDQSSSSKAIYTCSKRLYLGLVPLSLSLPYLSLSLSLYLRLSLSLLLSPIFPSFWWGGKLPPRPPH